MVYEEGLDNHSLNLSCNIRLHAANVAKIEFLTINHQIKLEYEELVAKRATLKLYDAPNFGFHLVKMPPGATRIPSVKLHLAARCVANLREHSDALSHVSWIKPFLQQQIHIIALAITINYESGNTTGTFSDVMDTLNTSFWSDIPQLQTLNVRDSYPRSSRRNQFDVFGIFDFSHEDPLILEWSSTARKVEFVA